MLRTIRRIIQILFLLFFLFLLLNTVYPADFIIPVDFILRLDPLAAVGIMLASRTLIAKFSYSIIFVALTLFIGRFFCGWLCPLGTTIDIADRLFFKRFKRIKVQPSPKLRNVKYYVLFFFIAGDGRSSNKIPSSSKIIST